MKNISIDLSEKINKTAVSMLIEIEKIAQKRGLSFFIVGATARDIILEHQFNIKPSRATIDIDIGIFVSGWDQFELLKDELLSLGEFKHSKQKQRLYYIDNFILDIIPFGAIATEDNSIIWPPENEIHMSIVGFQESYQHAISVKLSSTPELIVKVVSLAGLALLKIISWNDNPERRGKDAIDLFLIMKNYLDAGNLDRLIEKAIDLFEEKDYELASSCFLGRDIGDIATPETKAILVEILERELNSKQGHNIVIDVMQSDSYRNQSYERIVEYFEALLKGLAGQKA
jgi:predicted nucleotidyltransferase